MGKTSRASGCILLAEVMNVDQIKTGKFIAQLRKQYDLTQEALGEKLGVTNKTVSRWENGNYMPDIETLQLLSQTFDVSINEILSGEYLSDDSFRKKADENVIAALRESSFSSEDRKKYFKKKWLGEHILSFILLFLLDAAIVTAGILWDHTILFAVALIVNEIGCIYLRNQMMIYIENHIYGTKK